jgi:hypothetical protein
MRIQKENVRLLVDEGDAGGDHGGGNSLNLKGYSQNKKRKGTDTWGAKISGGGNLKTDACQKGGVRLLLQKSVDDRQLHHNHSRRQRRT